MALRSPTQIGMGEKLCLWKAGPAISWLPEAAKLLILLSSSANSGHHDEGLVVLDGTRPSRERKKSGKRANA